MTPGPDATSPASQVGMEGEALSAALIERLERRTLQRSFCDEKDLVNPDGPEAAAVIRDLEAENARLRSAPIPAVQSGAVARPVRYARVHGSTLDEMRDFIRSHPLYQFGDAVLCWVNEGDLYMGSAQEVSAPSGKEQA